jgi:hypothetical protein
LEAEGQCVGQHGVDILVRCRGVEQYQGRTGERLGVVAQDFHPIRVFFAKGLGDPACDVIVGGIMMRSTRTPRPTAA